jgi:salicylate hydroxylase
LSQADFEYLIGFRDHQESNIHFIGHLNTEKRSFYCHRAELVQTIARFIPKDQIHLGKALVNISQDVNSVTATFADGSSATANFLIGADGIRSTARSTWNVERPVFSNQVVVRNIVRKEDLPPQCHEYLDHGNVWLGPGKRHVVSFPIDQGRKIAIGAIIPSFGGHDWEESWKIRSQVDVLPIIEDFDQNVQNMFQRGFCQTVFGLYEREPLSSWIHGRIVLVGDAAHAMLPHQGEFICPLAYCGRVGNNRS